MSKIELLQAMKYGSRSIYDLRTQDDLGRFGLGLKWLLLVNVEN